MNNEPIIYVEKGFIGMDKVFLSDEEYAQATEAFIVTCADTLIVNRKEKKVYLSKRRARPAQDFWWMIGGRRKPGIPAREAMQKIFERETSLLIPLERFIFVDIIEYCFKTREQAPQENGVHMQGYTFVVELTQEELTTATKNLDPKEYYAELGLRAFSLAELKDGTHHPAIVTIASRVLQ